MSYLITCAGSKIKPSNYRPSNPLNLFLGQELLHFRLAVMSAAKIVLNWDYCLPAYVLYSGKHSQIYSQINELFFLSINSDVLILSALFGWIRPTDLIPYYDLRMSDKIHYENTEKPVWKFWENLNVLQNYVSEKDIDLLSGDYRKALSGNSHKSFATVPDIIFKGYGIQKGKWLNKQLEEINDPSKSNGI